MTKRKATVRFRHIQIEQGYDKVYISFLDDQGRVVYQTNPIKGIEDGQVIDLDFHEDVEWPVTLVF